MIPPNTNKSRMDVEMVEQADEEEKEDNPLLGYRDTVRDLHWFSNFVHICCCTTIWLIVIALILWVLIAVWSMLMAPSLYTWVEVCQDRSSDLYALRPPDCRWTSNTTLMCQQTLHNRSAVITNPYSIIHYRHDGYDIALTHTVQCIQIMIIWF